ncbi:uncharacterized protein LOC118196525 isoform X2 [Stegodyphus dumicola]|uniref:uncharacterized protein LOC118196525 isoform X2 n=1 Tax=Stegodyphus dumicola TaxID=202533 RepID=UPI0015B083CC|nr:uncharacterized protein LOC118196525 isoform X2 [Stegodyphus dumicola]
MGKKNPNSRIHSSRILGHYIMCLLNSIHPHMLYWVDKKNKIFEIKLVHRSSSKWEDKDISLLKELDQLFGDRYKGQKNYEENCRRRAQSNLNNLCERGLLKKICEKKETKSIRIARYKITESGWKIKELNNSTPKQKHGLQENEEAMETQPEDTVCTVSPPRTPDFVNLQVVPINSPVLIVGNSCFLVTSVNGGTSNKEKRNDFSANSGSTSHGNGSKANDTYDNKIIKNTMYGNGFSDARIYSNKLPNNRMDANGSSSVVNANGDMRYETKLPRSVAHLEESLNSDPLYCQEDREVQTKPEGIQNNCLLDASINGVTSYNGKRNEFYTNSRCTSHTNGTKTNDSYDNKLRKNIMYGNGLIDASIYSNKLPSNRLSANGSDSVVYAIGNMRNETQLPSGMVHLERPLSSSTVCSEADREVQTQPEEIPNNLLNVTPDGSLFETNTWDCSVHEIPSAGNQNLGSNLHLPPETQCIPNAEIENSAGSPLGDNQMETFKDLFSNLSMPTAIRPSETQPLSDLERENSALSPLADFGMELFGEIHLPDSPKCEDFNLLEIMERENCDGT